MQRALHRLHLRAGRRGGISVAAGTRGRRRRRRESSARVALHHLERVEDGIVSFGQGCEGEPLLRSTAIARAIEIVRGKRSNGTVNLNTNGSLPKALARCIDAGLDAVRVSLNSFRPDVYAAYYRPIGYGLEDVLASVRLACQAGTAGSA